MKRGKWIGLILAVCMVMALVLASSSPPEKEPDYKGKKLSKWLYLDIAENGKSEVASNAVREIGTNGLPWMMRCISYEPSSLQRSMRKFAGGWLSDIGGWNRRRDEALQGFRILKSTAQPVIPQLTEWASHAPLASYRRTYALVALKKMGNVYLQLPILVKNLRATNPQVREAATNELLRIAPEMLTNGVAKKF